MKKILVIPLVFLSYLSTMAFITAPSEFPNAFVDAVQQNVERTTDMIQNFDEISCVVGPISLMSKTSSFSSVKKFHAQLEELTMSEVAGTPIDDIRLSGLYKLAVPLVIEMNRQLLLNLAKLDELLEFWKEAEDYYVHWYLHKKSPREIVRRLEIHQEELYELLGTIAIHVNAVPLCKDAKTQYEWLRVLCNHFNACLPRQKTIVTKPIFEAVSALFSKAISSVEKFPESCERRLQRYAKPSWIHRNVGSVGAATLGVVIGGPSVMNNRKIIKENAQKGLKSVKKEVKRQRNLIEEAAFNQGKGIADIAKKRRKLGEEFGDYLYNFLLWYAKDEDTRKQALLYKLDAKNRNHGLDIGSSLPDLEAKHRELYKGDARKVLPCVVNNKLGGEHYAFLTPEAINRASQSADADFLMEEIIPLVTKTIVADGGSIDLMAQAGGQIYSDLRPTLEKLGKIQEAEGFFSKCKAAIWGKQEEESTEEADKKSEQPDRLDIGKVPEQLAEKAGPAVNSIATFPKLLDLIARSYKLTFEREKWRYKWTLAIINMAIACIPVYGVYKVSSWFHSRFQKKNTYDGLLETLRELKKLFLVNGDKQQSEMDPYDVGLTYYLVHKLERETVPKKFQKKFLQDVRLLQASNFTAHQKYNIVKDVLQDGYPFLRPMMQAA